MTRRIRLILFALVLVLLLYLIVQSSIRYGLSRDAQVEALREKASGWTANTDGEYAAHPPVAPAPSSLHPPLSTSTSIKSSQPESQQPPPQAPLEAAPSSPPPPPSTSTQPEPVEPQAPRNYTRALVVARTLKEIDISAWTHDILLLEDPHLTVYPYTVDLDPTSSFVPPDRTPENNPTVPKNKGHEAMSYLIHLITHYNSPSLADITLFMHAHRYTWHNNDLLDSDALNIVTRLSTQKVLREGYFNLRCHLDPGCPDHLHPATQEPNPARPEEMVIGQAWAQLFPGEPIPQVLSQPCCSQFALSKSMIRSVPLATYERMRDWLLTTEMHDAIAGRVFEYVWQKLYLRVNEWCPSEHMCYCDGYGVCFGGPENFYKWFADRKEWRLLWRESQLLERREKTPTGQPVDLSKPVPILPGQTKADVADDEIRFDGWSVEMVRERVGVVRGKMADWQAIMDGARREAFLRGNEPRFRALEVGRLWRDGDGF